MTAADASSKEGASVWLSKKTTLDLTNEAFRSAQSVGWDAHIDVQRLRTECSAGPLARRQITVQPLRRNIAPLTNPRQISYYAKTLSELLDTLPLELHNGVRDFVEFLLMKH